MRSPISRHWMTLAVFFCACLVAVFAQLDYDHVPVFTWASIPVLGHRRDWSRELWYVADADLPGLSSTSPPQAIVIKPLTEWQFTFPTPAPADTIIHVAQVNDAYKAKFSIIDTTDTSVTVKFLETSDWTLTETLKKVISITLLKGPNAVSNEPINFSLSVRLGDETTPPADVDTSPLPLPLLFTNTPFGIATLINHDKQGAELGQVLMLAEEKFIEDYYETLPEDQKPDPLPSKTTIIVSSASETTFSLQLTLLPAVIQQLDPTGDQIKSVDIIVEMGFLAQLEDEIETNDGETVPAVFSTNFFPLDVNTLTLTDTAPTQSIVFDPTVLTGPQLPAAGLNQTLFRMTFQHPTTKQFVPSATSTFRINPACMTPPASTVPDYFNPDLWNTMSCSETGSRGCNPVTGACHCRFNFEGPTCQVPVDVCGTVCDQAGTRQEWCNSGTFTADAMRTPLGCICLPDYTGPDCSQYFALCQPNVSKCMFGAQLKDETENTCTDKCFCIQEWEGEKCDTCNIKCQNGGAHKDQFTCEKCFCPAGHRGAECRCTARTATLVVFGDNDAINHNLAWSAEAKSPWTRAAYANVNSAVNAIFKELLVGITFSNPKVTVEGINEEPEKEDEDDKKKQSSLLTLSRFILSPLKFVSSFFTSDAGTAQVPTGPTNKTKYEFTFEFGCEESNPTLDEATLTTLWETIPASFANRAQFHTLFNVDMTKPEATSVTLLEKSKKTFPNGVTGAGLSFGALVLVALCAIAFVF